MDYWQQFGVIAIVHLLAVASPGPDFAIILKQSLRYGRRTAVFTSLGIGTGILVHVTYSLVGIGVIIANTPSLFTLLKYIAASYLLYIAYHGLTAKPQHIADTTQSTKNELVPSNKQAFVTGFLVNGLNVKATLFFVSLFSMVIAPQTPVLVNLAYGIYMALATAVWFASLSWLLAHPNIRLTLQRKGYWIDRIMGLVLLLLAIQLLSAELG